MSENDVEFDNVELDDIDDEENSLELAEDLDDIPSDTGTKWLGDHKEQALRFVRVALYAFAGALVANLSGLLSGQPITLQAIQALVVGAAGAGWSAAKEQLGGKPIRNGLLGLVGKRGATNAAARGWGNPGLPGSATGRSYQSKNVIVWSAGGIRISTHRAVAPIFKDLIEQLAKQGYYVSKVKDDWGYNHRYVRGSTSTLSNHSWGLAIDLNSTKNPMSTKLITDMPVAAVRALCKGRYYGLVRWGGDYSGRKDAMHFEFVGTPAEAAELIKRLGSPVVTSAPKPINKPVAKPEVKVVAKPVIKNPSVTVSPTKVSVTSSVPFDRLSAEVDALEKRVESLELK